jgi:hypothetical protein
VPDWRAIVAIVVIIILIAACGPVGTANTLQAIGHWFSVFFSALTS